jgi:hypothetical protein
MRRENFKRRLEVLEAVARLRAGPVEVRSIVFIDRHGFEAEAVIAHGPNGFTCRRVSGETLADFQARARLECFAARPPVPVAFLVFMTREASHAAA